MPHSFDHDQDHLNFSLHYKMVFCNGLFVKLVFEVPTITMDNLTDLDARIKEGFLVMQLTPEQLNCLDDCFIVRV